MEDRIRTCVQKVLEELGAPQVVFAVEWPGELAHGDYAVNAGLAASKTLGKSPREVAGSIVPALQAELGEDATSIEIAGPGFINITLAPRAVNEVISRATSLPGEWGTSSSLSGTTISIEYSCPNPFKEMHIGHLMSTVIGEALARLIEQGGAHVVRDTYGGDVGPHVAKALWGLEDMGISEPGNAEEVGRAYAHGSAAYEKSESGKAAIDTLNTKIYEALALEESARGEDERDLVERWRIGREVSVEAYRTLWERLGTHFDYVLFESETGPIGLRIVNDALEKGIFVVSDGAVIYPGEEKGLHTLVFITSRGTPTYETKDVGLAFLKEERLPADTYYIVTAAEQVGHFKVFLSALSEINAELAAKIHHVPHGFLRLTTGKMSSREGTVITAETLLHDITVSASEKNADPIVASQVALGAIKYMILRQAAGGDIIFDPEKSLSLDGDSGPYLQYSLVRARSVLEKAGDARESASEAPEVPYTLSRLIIRYPEVVSRAMSARAPHLITQYLTQLASSWNSFYAQEKIIGGAYEAHKLELVRAFVITMQHGLDTLGIPTPTKM